MNLVPINGHVLIELLDNFEYAVTPEQQYSTKISGYVRAYPKVVSSSSTYKGVTMSSSVAFKTEKELMDKRVWFSSYQDDVKIEQDDKNYTFVKFEDIKGYCTDENT